MPSILSVSVHLSILVLVAASFIQGEAQLTPSLLLLPAADDNTSPRIRFAPVARKAVAAVLVPRQRIGALSAADGEGNVASIRSQTGWWAYRDGNESAARMAIDGCDPLATSAVERRIRSRRTLLLGVSPSAGISDGVTFVCIPHQTTGDGCIGGEWVPLHDDYSATVVRGGYVLPFPSRALSSGWASGGGTRSQRTSCNSIDSAGCGRVSHRFSPQLPAASRLETVANFAWRAALRQAPDGWNSGTSNDVLALNAELRLAESCGASATGCLDADGTCGL